MPCRVKAMITLVVIAPLLTELVSGNTPPHAFLHPSITLFLIGAYSFPLLVLREFAVRRRLASVGVFVLGLAYGLLNEGLIAQTLIRADRVPMPNFDRYVYGAGVNFSWLAVIVPWHALMAVLFPLALLAHWFPSCAGNPWLGRRAFAALSGVLIACVTFIGFVRAPHTQMRAFLLAMALLVALASILRGKRLALTEAPARRVLPFLLGILFYAGIFLTPMILANKRVCPAIFFATIAGLLLASAWLSRRAGFAIVSAGATIALGSYFAASLFNMVGGFRRHSVEAVTCGGLLAAVLVILGRINPQCKPQTAPAQTR